MLSAESNFYNSIAMKRTDHHLGLLLERAGRVVGERLDRAIGRDGITSDHWRVLRVLADEEGHTMGEIAERLQMNPPTLTLPVGFTAAGMPIAAQFVGKPLGEAAVVRAGRAFQRVTDFHRRHPRV